MALPPLPHLQLQAPRNPRQKRKISDWLSIFSHQYLVNTPLLFETVLSGTAVPEEQEQEAASYLLP